MRAYVWRGFYVPMISRVQGHEPKGHQMIKLLKNASQTVDAKGAIILNWNVRAEDAKGRAANHNLTRDARNSNVVVIGGHHAAPDFRPDLGARLPLAA